MRPLMMSDFLYHFQVENEDNVLVCLRIIIELHKQFRPPHSGEITHFLHFVQSIYKELPNRLNKVRRLPRLPLTFTLGYN